LSIKPKYYWIKLVLKITFSLSIAMLSMSCGGEEVETETDAAITSANLLHELEDNVCVLLQAMTPTNYMCPS